MKPICERANLRRFTAFPALDTIEPIWGRVESLLNTQRRIVYTERYLGSPELRIETGLRVATDTPLPGAHFERGKDYVRFRVLLDPGIHGFGLWAGQDSGSEDAQAERFFAKRDGIRVRIEGYGEGRGDQIEITRWNERGVGNQVVIAFDYEECDQVAEHEAAFLEGLAAQGDWSAEQLGKLAAEARYEWRPAVDLAREARKAVES
ncbi:hypothetical protein [Nocardia aurea]|uniref:hypothetical protein n=1 Tax=Nocardia aurea TaxID=2144174 RepID=UPI0033A9D148